MHILFLIDPPETLNQKKDSSLALMAAACTHGMTVAITTLDALGITESRPYAEITFVTVDGNCRMTVGTKQHMPLTDFDVICMRKDPPVDAHYVYATYLLEMAERNGVRVINRPRSLRDCNEKLYALNFAECIPPHLVTHRAYAIRDFVDIHTHAVIKPLDQMGGNGIFRLSEGDANTNAIIETVTHGGTRPVMVQPFLEAIYEGDKRILLIDGEPIPYALARIPQGGDFRGNLAAGGRFEIRELTERDRWLCAQIKNDIKERGLFFVGLDVIGDFITEINITSPTCIREIHMLTDCNAAKVFIQKFIKNKNAI